MVVLGKVGKNFGAGMTGGLAYVWCPPPREQHFHRMCNKETFALHNFGEDQAFPQDEQVITQRMFG